MATYKDIQRLTGLSLSTISKYFNDLPVREENREAIENAAEELDFRPNALARGLRSKRSRVVGVLLPALDNPFHMLIIAGIEERLRGEGVGILVRAGGDDPMSGLTTLREQMVDGIILIPTDNMDATALKTVIRDLPLVLVDRRVDGLLSDSVTIDNRAAGAKAAECFLAFGHHRVTAILGPSSTWTMRGREEGFVSAFGSSGEVTVLHAQDLSVASGHAEMMGALASANRPSAVFCANYELTLGALMALSNASMNIPEDISLVGFDGEELSQVTKPRLWTMVQPIEQIAEQASGTVLSRLRGDASAPRSITLDALLLPGDSVAHTNLASSDIPLRPEHESGESIR